MKIPVLCLSLSLIVCSGVAAQAPATSPKPAASSSSTGAHPTTHRMTVDPALLHPARLTAHAPDIFEATFVTTKGNFVVQVTRAWAPIGADRFYNLVKHGFFNGAPFFRVMPGFVVQFGLTGDPAVNHAWENASIKDDPVKQSNVPGTLVFAATSQRNSRSTQLFINLGNNSSSLDPQGFAPFGKVISGMDVVQSIYSGYGEDPDQGRITDDGSKYFLKAFPKMDLIKTATITSPAPTATHSSTTTPHHATPSGGSKPTQ
jgi:peptidyl-prolyl cis-trans isomerase A (cyclophilin A)